MSKNELVKYSEDINLISFANPKQEPETFFTDISLMYENTLFNKTKELFPKNFIFNLYKILQSNNRKLLRFYIYYVVNYKCEEIVHHMELKRLENILFLTHQFSPYTEIEEKEFLSLIFDCKNMIIEEKMLETFVDCVIVSKGNTLIDSSIKDVLENTFNISSNENEEDVMKMEFENNITKICNITGVKVDFPFNEELVDEMTRFLIESQKTKSMIELSPFYLEKRVKRNKVLIKPIEFYNKYFIKKIKINEMSEKFFQVRNQSGMSEDEMYSVVLDTIVNYSYINIIKNLNEDRINVVNSRLTHIINQVQLHTKKFHLTDELLKKYNIETIYLTQLRSKMLKEEVKEK